MRYEGITIFVNDNGCVKTAKITFLMSDIVSIEEYVEDQFPSDNEVVLIHTKTLGNICVIDTFDRVHNKWMDYLNKPLHYASN